MVYPKGRVIATVAGEPAKDQANSSEARGPCLQAPYSSLAHRTRDTASPGISKAHARSTQVLKLQFEPKETTVEIYLIKCFERSKMCSTKLLVEHPRPLHLRSAHKCLAKATDENLTSENWEFILVRSSCEPKI